MFGCSVKVYYDAREEDFTGAVDCTDQDGRSLTDSEHRIRSRASSKVCVFVERSRVAEYWMVSDGDWPGAMLHRPPLRRHRT